MAEDYVIITVPKTIDLRSYELILKRYNKQQVLGPMTIYKAHFPAIPDQAGMTVTRPVVFMNIRLVSYFHFSGRGPHFRTSRPLRIPPAGETGPGPAARRPHVPRGGYILFTSSLPSSSAIRRSNISRPRTASSCVQRATILTRAR